MRALALAAGLLAAGEAGAVCRQALALGLDVSGSVDLAEYRLQREGLAAALGAPQVRAALLDVPGTFVMIAVYEWSGPDNQVEILPWTAIRSATELDAARGRIREVERRREGSNTALGAAMAHGLALLMQVPDCWRHTLDISGDGKSNAGAEPASILVPTTVTINGLVIGADDARTGDARLLQVGELSAYYAREVLHGPGAFLEIALGFEDFEAAMTRKLLQELQVIAIGALDDGAPAGRPDQ